MGVATVVKSNNQDIDGVLVGTKWNPITLTFSFPTSAVFYGSGYGGNEPQNNFEVLNGVQQAATRAIYAEYASFTNLTFTELTESATTHADLRLAMSDAGGSTAHGYYPAAGAVAGDAWFFNSSGDYDNPVIGTYAYHTFMHEIGHTLGLKHGHDTTGFGPLPSAHDGQEYSIMTYRSWVGSPTNGYTIEFVGYPQTPMQDDIAALQYMYGANFNTNSGNTTYSWSPTTGQMFINGSAQQTPAGNRILMTLWDGGGNDTYDFTNYSTNITVDLTPGGWTALSSAQLSNFDIGHAGHAARGNIANALLYQNNPASLIENVLAGPGNDTILGNDANNLLNGGAGADTINGGNGNDTLVGAAGNDTLTGGAGDDRFVFAPGSGLDTITDFAAGLGSADEIDLTAFAAFNSLIAILNATVVLTATTSRIDLSPGNSITLNVSRGSLTTNDFIIVSAGNSAPIITSNGGGANATIPVPENTSVVTTVAATDADGGTTLTFSIVGGADQARFQINPISGVLSFFPTPDFEAPADTDHNNSYIVQVRASDGALFDDQTITVDVSNVSESNDDFPATISTTGHLTVGGSATGNLETAGDHDWFSVSLNAGASYTIQMQGSPTAFGTLSNPALLLFNSLSQQVASNDDFGGSANSQITFVPTAGGTYYIDAGAHNNNLTGTYTVSVSTGDDFAGNIGTLGQIVIGGSATGNLETLGDRDWFRVQFVAGTSYTIQLQGAPTGNGTLSDPTLYLYNSAGVQLAANDDFGTSLNSQLSFAATITGTYYVGAAGFDDGRIGSYTARVFTGDDFSANSTTTGAVTLGNTAFGTLEALGDHDWFRVQLAAGTNYLVQLQGADTGFGTLSDPLVQLRNAAGVVVASNNDIDPGVVRDALLTYTASVTGTYFIDAGAFNNAGTGSYAVTLKPGDDYAGSTATTGTLAVNGSNTGTLESLGDRDWFRVQLTQGVLYTADIRGGPSGAGTLSDSYLYIYGNAGQLLYSSDDFAGLTDSHLAFTINTTGTYYVAVGAYADSFVGSYSVSLVTDDFRGDINTTRELFDGYSIFGNLEALADRDWFRVHLTAGYTYAIDLEGTDSGGGSLSDPYLRFYNSAGTLVPGINFGNVDDAGTGRNSFLSFTPTASGVYYVAAGAFDDETAGSYTASLTLTAAPPVGHTDIFITPKSTALHVGGAGVLANDIDDNGDFLTALLATNPGHGTVSLAAGGSFTYTPTNNFVGNDSFSYRPNDGSTSGNVTTVSIAVGNIDALTTDAEQIGQLYLGYYNRAPDSGGLNFWITTFNTPGTPFFHNLTHVAASFADPGQTETVALYPFFANPGAADFADVTAFITDAYDNLFNRGPDQLGLNYWSAGVAKSLGIGVPIFNNPVLDGVAALPSSSTLLALIRGALGSDAAIVANKVIAGLYYSTATSENGLTATLEDARNALLGVTDDVNSVVSAEDDIDATIFLALPAAKPPTEVVGLGTGDPIGSVL